jgi:hypothetical protein
MSKDTTEMKAAALATATECARQAAVAEDVAAGHAAAGDLSSAQTWWDNADGHRGRARRALHRAATGRPA